MHYFDYHPTVSYKLGSDTRDITDITRRLTLNTILGDRNTILYDYTVQEHDRPDIIAEKYYGDSTLDWVLFLTNDILDPYFQWPVNSTDLDNWIRQTYGSVSVAMGTVHHYEWIVTRQSVVYNSDGEEIQIPEKKLIVDQTTYNTLPATDKREVDTYTYHLDLNTKRRNIKILDAVFIPSIRQSVPRLFEV